jgi:hypothetical protein
MAKATITARLEGARALGGRLEASARNLPVLLSQEMRGRLSASLVRVYAAVAPVRTGRLRAAITGQARDRTLEIISPVKSDEGFSYTGATRFGRGPVRPVRAKALRFQVGGRTVFSKFARAYRPSRDWAQTPLEAAKREVSQAGQRVGRTALR